MFLWGICGLGGFCVCMRLKGVSSAGLTLRYGVEVIWAYTKDIVTVDCCWKKGDLMTRFHVCC